MRACTAVVTELSYNYSDNHAYIAEIEFISEEDWTKELKLLYQDLLDNSGNVSREATSTDSDASVAYAKLKAVYPKMTRETMAEGSHAKMIREVSHILGKTRTVKDDDSLRFYKQLQRYLDSQEKSTGKDDKKKKEPKEMELWVTNLTHCALDLHMLTFS